MSRKKEYKQRSGKVKSSPVWSNMLKNGGLLVASLMLVFWVKDNVKGYMWVSQNLIANNLTTMEKYHDADYHKKMELKFAFNYNYVKYLKENTPEDAVILLPKDTLETYFVTAGKNKKKQKLKFIAYSKWVSYFVYPRRVVKEGDTTSLRDSISHVAIVNGNGYENLPYPVGQRQQFSVLPIDPSLIKKNK